MLEPFGRQGVRVAVVIGGSFTVRLVLGIGGAALLRGLPRRRCLRRRGGLLGRRENDPVVSDTLPGQGRRERDEVANDFRDEHAMFRHNGLV